LQYPAIRAAAYLSTLKEKIAFTIALRRMIMSECDLGLTIGEDRLSNYAENTALSISIDGHVQPEKLADRLRKA
jgi:hypothetical protein